MKGIMIQGTASDVGKSYITTAICRLLANKGMKVCPYKSQNMSNNSYVTYDGGEIGRAQGVQAEAAKVEPETFMNPILLKPQKDTQSEIVLMGKVYRSESGMGYRKNFALTKGLETIKQTKEIIEDKFDCVVIEGAGSPAEVNLNDKEIVNMRVAEIFDVPVVLVVDIDRGGSFASIVGTLELVFEHRHRIKGVIFNKFRGDIRLLEDGLRWLEEYADIEVLGVLPYLTDIHVEVEDAHSKLLLNNYEVNEPLDIGIIHMGRVSNNTDVEPFIQEKDVSIRIIKSAENFGNPDAIILPGTKSTIGDLDSIMESNLGDRIKQYNNNGGIIMGICGGYQILGQKIYDPNNVDNKSRHEVDGLDVLPVDTIFKQDKKVRNIQGRIINTFTEQNISGYEIHLGDTLTKYSNTAFAKLDDGTMDGCVIDNGRVTGTYLHNIFHNDKFRNEWLNMIREKSGKEKQDIVDTKDIKEQSYEKLAKVFEENINMDRIIEIMEGAK